jgi:hypothetical protein
VSPDCEHPLGTEGESALDLVSGKCSWTLKGSSMTWLPVWLATVWEVVDRVTFAAVAERVGTSAPATVPMTSSNTQVARLGLLDRARKPTAENNIACAEI